MKSTHISSIAKVFEKWNDLCYSKKERSFAFSMVGFYKNYFNPMKSGEKLEFRVIPTLPAINAEIVLKISCFDLLWSKFSTNTKTKSLSSPNKMRDYFFGEIDLI